MNTIERQEFRLEILKKICEQLDYNILKTIDNMIEFKKLFQGKKEVDIFGSVIYLNEKGYLDCKIFDGSAAEYIVPITIKLTTKGIDLIEKLETDMPTDNYQQDFSLSALNNFKGNIIGSNIIIGSPNARITITENEQNEIIEYLKDLLNKNPNNPTLQEVYEKTEERVKNNTLTKDYLQGVGMTLKSIMLNMGISITSNLLTPKVIEFLDLAKTLIP